MGYVENQAFTNYQIYFAFPVCYGLLPSIILIITDLLTYRNTNKLQIIRQRQIFQKQLTSIMLIQILIILFSTLPYVIFFAEYSIFTAKMAKSTNQRAIELMITNIVSITCYITFACPFFDFFASSTSFRKEAKILFLCRKTTPLRTNQMVSYPTTSLKNIKSTTINKK
ncbi:unnamed protein product [Rotaria sordida]|uniref:G-protein coupled receptors family 1 profile domain-containing protein n=1 Tax=Rotaria sordida TaxID=392033 RepID=A0A815F4G9_9BILA|nr:unnamed protein product [Rotaria sordida]CAF1324170.1 unnamed protein product [Rotaria sordida]